MKRQPKFETLFSKKKKKKQINKDRLLNPRAEMATVLNRGVGHPCLNLNFAKFPIGLHVILQLQIK